MRALVNATVHTGEQVLERHAVLILDQTIVDIVPAGKIPGEAAPINLDGGILAPGFVDLQVNGGGGVLFNDQPTVATIARIGAAHRQFGTTGFLPTLISDDRETMAQAIAAVASALEEGVPGVLGIHLEGPFVNQARKGAHDGRKIRPLGAGDVELLASLSGGSTMVTLAPERVGAEVIATLAAKGIRVSAGHTDATTAELKPAIAQGVACFTHLFNAMRPFAGREPGAVGTALADRDVWCTIIVDGHHVHYDSVRIAWRAKPAGKLILVSDAMAPVGADMAEFRLGEERIEVRDGRCLTADGRLAGSVLDMATAVRNAHRQVGIPLDEALRMAARYPAEFLGLADRIGRLAPGLRANLVLLDPDLTVRASWIDGQMAP